MKILEKQIKILRKVAKKSLRIKMIMMSRIYKERDKQTDGVEKRKGSKETDDESTLKVRMIKGNASELSRFTLNTKGSIVSLGLHVTTS